MTDLKQFCGKEDSRYIFTTPFTVNGWTYATDARISVRVKTSEPDSEDPKKYPPCANIFANRPTQWEPWPERHYCPQCFDVGTIGGYKVTYESYDETITEDPDPFGKRPCLLCNGRGPSGEVVAGYPAHIIRVGDNIINVLYDAIILALDNVRFSREIVNGNPMMIPFDFDGGQGATMVIDKKSVNPDILKRVFGTTAELK